MHALHEIAVPEALSLETLRALRARLEAIEGGVIVLRGGPTTFCRGLDFGALGSVGGAPVGAALEDFGACLLSLRGAAAPVIAVVEGAALGGGLGLAACADHLIAGPNARFGLPEVLFGLSPAMVFPAIDERVGAARARRLALSAASVDAPTALAWGLADELTPQSEEAVSRALRGYRRITREGVREVKRHPYRWSRFELGVVEGQRMTRAALEEGSVRARLSLFVEGGALPWE